MDGVEVDERQVGQDRPRRRVFVGGKAVAFYSHNGFFWLKLGLSTLVVALELAPMITFIRVRVARKRRSPLPAVPVDAYPRINHIEMALVVVIVFVAAFMARRAWLF